jgi:cation:H+ antiporter
MRIFAAVFLNLSVIMLMNIVLLLVGTALVLWGADKFTDGACGVARRWNVSELVIGLTIVAMGTSLPELIVSLFSSIRGSGDMSVGNIVGSNIFNTLVIIGASAMAMNIAVSRVTLYRDVSLSFGVAVVLFLMGRDGELTRLEGALLLGVFACFLYNLFVTERKNKKNQTEAPEQPKDIEPVWKLLLFLVIGVASLVGGGQLLVNNAAELARSWGVSESVIGLTILAGGTSLPELATSVVAARKGSNDLALGNALGSNIFNITLVLGLCNVISPMHIPLISTTDWAFLIGSNVVLAVCAFTRMRLCRLEGLVLLLCYAAYLTLLFSV